MPVFRYTARNSENEPVSGTLVAASEEAALEDLTNRGLLAIQIAAQESAATEAAANPSDSKESRGEVLFDDDVGTSLEQITGAGLPLESGLRLLAETHPSPKVSHKLLELSNRLARGESWEQISETSHANLPPVYQDLFQLKLAPGQMSELLNRYLHYTLQASKTRRRIWGGLLYSVIILASLTLMVGYLLMDLVPQFKQIFEGFDTELPASTIALVNLSDFVIKYGWMMIAFLAVLFVLLRVAGGRSFRRLLQRLTRVIPVTGTAFQGADLSTFCHLLAELVRRRIPLDVSLEIAAAGSKDLTLQAECEELSEQVRKGVPLDYALSSLTHYRTDLLHVFRWSSQSQQFVDALHAAGDAFDGQARERAGMIPVVVEPFMLFFILVTVLSFAGALLLPLIKLLNDLS